MRETFIGYAKILEVFKVSGVGKVAGKVVGGLLGMMLAASGGGI